MVRKFLITLIVAISCMFIFCVGACTDEKESSSSNKEVIETPVKSVYFDDEVYTLDRFSILKLNANYQGNETLTWTSSDETVAIVKDCVVLARKSGTAEICVKVGEEEARCKVVVRSTTGYLSLSLSQDEIEISKGKQKTVYASLLDNFSQSMPDQFVSYSYEVENENIASVDENGVVTALQIGETKIIVSATCAGETLREEIRVEVKENINISFDKGALSLYSNSLKDTVSKSEQLTVYVYQDDELLTSPVLSYCVADENVATISASGLVTGIARGETSVTVSYVSASSNIFTATIEVEVVCPTVAVSEPLTLEVYAPTDTKIDLSSYKSYFSGEITEVEAYDDLGFPISVSVDDGVVTLKNKTLNYGDRTFSLTVNSELVFAYEATVITKYISMASELAVFASKYGNRDATGTYSGWFVLTDNIDMTDVKIDYSFGSDGVWSNETNYGFKGIFDGNGYSVYNIKDNVFGRVSKDGVIKNTAFYSTQAVNYALISGLFAGRLENVYVCADLSNVSQDYFTGVTFRTIGTPVFENLVVEITAKRDSVKATMVYDAQKTPACVNVYLVSPSAKDATTETNNLLPIHYATADINKDFSNLDKSSGFWKNVNGTFRFSSCDYFALERLSAPDKSTFTIGENKTLSWMEVENAEGYTVLINGQKEQTQSNYITGLAHGAVILVRANGDDVTFRDSEYSETFIYLEVTGNYLADFSTEAYTQLVEESTGEYYIPTKLDAEYVENVLDKNGNKANNAIKITSLTNSITIGFGDFSIKLPKVTTQTTVTLRFMISSQSADGLMFRTMNATGTGGAKELTNYEKDVWHIVSFSYAKDMEFIYFRVCNAKNVKAILYLDCIMDGDCAEELQSELAQEVLNSLKSNLTDEYLADFSSGLYSNVFSTAGISYPPTSIETEFIENMEGSTNGGALKVTIKVPQVGNASQANLNIMLPKEMTKDKHQMRLMIESEGLSEGWYFRTLKSDGGDVHMGTPNTTGLSKQTDVWCTVDITNVYTDYIRLRIGATDVKSFTFTFYIDWIR